MKNRITEYRILKYYAKKNDFLVTSQVAEKLKLDVKLTRDEVKSLQSNKLLIQSMIDINGISTSAYKITGSGIARFNKMRGQRTASFVGTLVGVLGLLVAIIQIFR